MGPNGILHTILKELADVIAKPHLMIFERSWESRQVPADWKFTNIVLICKKGNKEDPRNYRILLDKLSSTELNTTSCAVCVFEGRTYFEGQRETVYSSSGDCVLFECKDHKMQRIPKDSCTALNCPESQQILLSHSCCKICKGHDFCTEGHNCMEHSVCRNLDDRAICSCRDGFRALREDNAYCEDIDECAEGRHYCRENTMCVNTPGSFMCVCKTGYIRIDDYSCTEHDECITNQHNCDENALCFNTVGGHNCVCKPGYTGNGTICKAFCKDGCRNGGACIASNVCACPQGFTGPSCETDIDECSDGFVQCDSRANCINLPGWYHCECRDGYHDNGMFSPSGESCEGLIKQKLDHYILLNGNLDTFIVKLGLPAYEVSISSSSTSDIDECGTGRHSCANDTVCFNLDGGYDCRCPHGKNCTGDCIHEDKIKHNGQIWVLENDRCSVCSCQQGEVDCWPLPCPEVDCEFSVLPENECCPRCVTDPCQADTIRNDITKTCLDETNVIRFTGSSWIKHGTECTLCQCKDAKEKELKINVSIQSKPISPLTALVFHDDMALQTLPKSTETKTHPMASFPSAGLFWGDACGLSFAAGVYMPWTGQLLFSCPARILAAPSFHSSLKLTIRETNLVLPEIEVHLASCSIDAQLVLKLLSTLVDFVMKLKFMEKKFPEVAREG
ncbi:neural EGFL like 2 [Pitangus sulphuratus]|nr:neural EGFL like 2 [Pitangus sulphuratus]